MRKTLMLLICAVVAAAATGCASVSCSTPGQLDGIKLEGTDGKPSQIVFISTSGFYIFSALPLGTGDIRWNSEKKSIEGGCSLFTDQISREGLQEAITKYADSRDCDVVDIYYSDDGASYADASEVGLIGMLFSSVDTCVSAVLVPRSSKKQGE